MRSKPTKEEVQAAARVLSRAGASKGGRARWAGKTAEDKRSHALLMVEARRKKKVENKP